MSNAKCIMEEDSKSYFMYANAREICANIFLRQTSDKAKVTVRS